MNPYMILSSGLGLHEAAALGARLSAWHDAMVGHERRLRAAATSDVCDDECPHAEARGLWSEAVAAFGARAQELTFLRSRAQETRRSLATIGSPHARSQAAEDTNGRPPDSRADTTPTSPVVSRTVVAEL